MDPFDHDVIVIGAGMTGLTATRRLAQGGLDVANVEGGLFGGLITNVNELEGEYLGSGVDLASTLMMELDELGCAMLSESVTAVRVDGDGDGDGDAVVVTTDAKILRARAAIVASGAQLKRLGVPGEAELEYKGVSRCADCDGPMFQGQVVVVVGGGDSALQEAHVLSQYCAHVHIVHRGADFSARPHWVDALRECANVSVIAQSEVIGIDGADGVQGVRVRGLGSQEQERTIACAGVFAYVGLVPTADFMPAQAQRDATGALVTDELLETTLRNVFAAGAVRAGYSGTLTDATREATLAADSVLARLRDGTHAK
jgi:thioredoxin reductase (NADPH)